MTQDHSADENKADKPAQRVPWLEWLAAGIGFFLVLGVFSVIGWQAFNGATPPVVTVVVDTVEPVEGGYRILFRALNRAAEAAAQVEIEGTVSTDGGEEVSRVVLDYVPGHSERHGGLFFTHDPRGGSLAVRATGFVAP